MAALQAIGSCTMEEWLRQQAENKTAKHVNVRMSSSTNPVLFFGTWRTTHSDVISVVTTTRRCAKAEKWKRGRSKIKPPVPFNKPIFHSPLRQWAEVRETEHGGKNTALWREEQIFISKLDSRRFEREDLEIGAVTSIQRCTRGFLMRQYFKREKRRLRAKARMKTSYKNVARQMRLKREMEENLRRQEKKKYLGVILLQAQWRAFMAVRAAEKEKLTLREELLNWAAVRIQTLVRSRFACRGTAKLHQRLYMAERGMSARRIQCAFRGFVGKRRFAGRLYLLMTLAASLIQTGYRLYLARKLVRKEKAMQQLQNLNDSAIILQAVIRGINDRHIVCAMLRHEQLLLRHGASLCVQRVFRGSLSRMFVFAERDRQKVETRWCAAMHIQRIMRGYWGRGVGQQRREEMKENVFVQARLGNLQAVEMLLSGFGDSKYDLQSLDDDGNSPLLIAAKWGHKKMVRKLLKMGMDIDHNNDLAQSAADLAVTHGHEGLAEYLISKDCEISFFGRTLLHEAAKLGMYGVALALIHRGIRIDERDPKDRTSLLEAAKHNQKQVVQLLLDRNADVNAVDAQGSSPLHHAATNGNLDLVVLFIKGGADLALRDNLDHTPWRCALLGEHTEAAQVLRKAWSEMVGKQNSDTMAAALPEEAKAAAVAAAKQDDLQAVKELLEIGAPIDLTDSTTGNTILMGAAMAGSKRIIDLCLRKGCDVNRANNQGETALHFAKKKVAAYLIKRGADMGKQDTNGQTPLFRAVSLGYLFAGCTAELANLPDGAGATLLIHALKHKKFSVFQKLLALKADPAIQDNMGLCAVHHAAADVTAHGFLDALIALKSDPGVSLQDYNDDTPVHAACKAGNHAALDKMLHCQFKAAIHKDINGQNTKGRTPLLCAVNTGSVPCLTALLVAMADPTIADHENGTPLRAALTAKPPANECAKILLGRGAEVASEAYQSDLLLMTASAGNAEGIMMLLEVSPAAMLDTIFEKEDDDSYNVLTHAVANGLFDAVQALMSAGCPCDKWRSVDDDSTILHLAVRNSAGTDVLDYLITEGAMDVSVADSEGLTALHWACQKGQADLVEILVATTPLDIQNTHTGRTPFHLAAEEGHIDCMAHLLYNGHDLNAADINGFSILKNASSAAVEWIEQKKSEYKETGAYIWE